MCVSMSTNAVALQKRLQLFHLPKIEDWQLDFAIIVAVLIERQGDLYKLL